MTSLYLIAGEASGDALGGKLMRALKKQSKQKLTFYGIGGAQMQREGLISLFPMEELSLLGFLEIIPHIPKLLNRVEQTADDILAKQPDVVITIDAPAFTRRVVRKVREKQLCPLSLGERARVRGKTPGLKSPSPQPSPQGRGSIRFIHYVAPSVWAYKPKRAEKMAALFDHLLCLLPFEPPYFEKVGLPASFIGHPIVEENVAGGDGKAFRESRGIAAGTPLLGILPGSRTSELKRHLPVLKQAAEKISASLPHTELLLFATPRFKERLEHETTDWPLKVHVFCEEKTHSLPFKEEDRGRGFTENHTPHPNPPPQGGRELFEAHLPKGGRERYGPESLITNPQSLIPNPHSRANALAACNAALAKSGTGTLEFAMASVPMAVFYKVNPLSAWLLKRMIRVEFVNLINIIHQKRVIPELLQADCTPQTLADVAIDMLMHPEKYEAQRSLGKAALNQLGFGQPHTPSEKAAGVVFSLLSNEN